MRRQMALALRAFAHFTARDAEGRNMTLRQSPRSGGTRATPEGSRVPHRQAARRGRSGSVSVSDSVSTALTAERTDTESDVLLVIRVLEPLR